MQKHKCGGTATALHVGTSQRHHWALLWHSANLLEHPDGSREAQPDHLFKTRASTIGIEAIDRAARAMYYFHNGGYFRVEGDDFTSLFAAGHGPGTAPMPLFAELVRLADVPWHYRPHDLVATDDERIRDCVEGFGGQAVMTRSDHPSGSDRLAEAAHLLELAPEDIVVNIQGDQPLFPLDLITRLAEPLHLAEQLLFNIKTFHHGFDHP